MNHPFQFFKYSQTYLLFICLLLAAPVKANDPSLDVLLQQINDRLQLMQAVAAHKYVNGIAIENTEREASVLASAILSAQQNGLEPKSVETFFRLQIELAKTVQQSWFAYWRAENKQPVFEGGIPDLKTKTRPELISLGKQIIEQIPKALAALHDDQQLRQNLERVEKVITTRFVSKGMKYRLLHTLILIRSQSSTTGSGGGNRLTDILRQGVLRVGTTGDYKPFSYIEADTGKHAGIDIDLAKDLAASLGVELKLVATSWPTLMADLTANRFDIGMSGISRTLLRQRTAFFSNHYSIGGKTPIARCEVVNTLNTLSKIDQPSVRIIVNPGGTNQKFVRGHIKNAQIITYPDNTTIFEQIVQKNADVMITDAIEVKLQANIHPQLCATMPGKLLTHAEKGFLLPQDIYLLEYVDAWLRQINQSGRLDNYFSHHLNNPSKASIRK